MEKELTITALFREQDTSIAFPHLAAYTYPWEALADIRRIIAAIIETLPRDEYTEVTPDVWIAKTAKIAPTAFIGAPCIICADAEVRHCAFIRGSAIVGRGAVVGNSVELKNCILFDGVQVPHFNYVGDSILGYRSHMGAGSITSNVKSDKTPVTVRTEHGTLQTGMKKFGAMLGDYVEVGCNSVLNPGTVIGSHSNIYPLSSVRGFIPAGSIYKDKDNIIKKI